MAIKVDNDNEIVLVDDDSTEALLLQRYIVRSRLTNPVRAFQEPDDFLLHLNEVEKGAFAIPALVLIDVRMAANSGFDLVRTVREREAFADLPLIAMFSNSDAPSDIRRATDVGADGYIVKPGSGEEYIEFLNSLVRDIPAPTEQPVGS